MFTLAPRTGKLKHEGKVKRGGKRISFKTV